MSDTAADAPTETEVNVAIDVSGEDLTLNERIAVEEVCHGRPFDEIRDEGRSSFYRAVAWVVGRRSDPRLTLEEAGELRVRFEIVDGGR